MLEDTELSDSDSIRVDQVTVTNFTLSKSEPYVYGEILDENSELAPIEGLDPSSRRRIQLHWTFPFPSSACFDMVDWTSTAELTRDAGLSITFASFAALISPRFLCAHRSLHEGQRLFLRFVPMGALPDLRFRVVPRHPSPQIPVASGQSLSYSAPRSIVSSIRLDYRVRGFIFGNFGCRPDSPGPDRSLPVFFFLCRYCLLWSLIGV